MSSDENYEEDFDYGEEFENDNNDAVEHRSERNVKDDNASITNENDEDHEDEALSANDDSAPTSPMNQASYERLDPSTRIISSNEDRLRQAPQTSARSNKSNRNKPTKPKIKLPPRRINNNNNEDDYASSSSARRSPTKTKTFQQQEEYIAKLQSSNVTLRAQLKDFSRALDASLKAQVAATKAANAGGRGRGGSGGSSHESTKKSLRSMLANKDKVLTGIKKKLEVYKRANEQLKSDLHEAYSSEKMLQLANEMSEREREIQELILENKNLVKAQRLQAKEIERYEAGLTTLPARLTSAQDDLRTTRDRARKLKDKLKHEETSNNKQHQQLVVLTEKNKALARELKKYENASVSNRTSSRVPGNGNTNLTKKAGAAKLKNDKNEQAWLEQRAKLLTKVNMLERTNRQDRIKSNAEVKRMTEEAAKAKKKLAGMKELLEMKEKEIRSQLVQVKLMKRNVREIALGKQPLPERPTPWAKNMEAFAADTEIHHRPTSTNSSASATKARGNNSARSRSSNGFEANNSSSNPIPNYNPNPDPSNPNPKNSSDSNEANGARQGRSQSSFGFAHNMSGLVKAKKSLSVASNEGHERPVPPAGRASPQRGPRVKAVAESEQSPRHEYNDDGDVADRDVDAANSGHSKRVHEKELERKQEAIEHDRQSVASAAEDQEDENEEKSGYGSSSPRYHTGSGSKSVLSPGNSHSRRRRESEDDIRDRNEHVASGRRDERDVDAGNGDVSSRRSGDEDMGREHVASARSSIPTSGRREAKEEESAYSPPVSSRELNCETSLHTKSNNEGSAYVPSTASHNRRSNEPESVASREGKEEDTANSPSMPSCKSKEQESNHTPYVKHKLDEEEGYIPSARKPQVPSGSSSQLKEEESYVPSIRKPDNETGYVPSAGKREPKKVESAYVPSYSSKQKEEEASSNMPSASTRQKRNEEHSEYSPSAFVRKPQEGESTYVPTATSREPKQDEPAYVSSYTSGNHNSQKAESVYVPSTSSSKPKAAANRFNDDFGDIDDLDVEELPDESGIGKIDMEVPRSSNSRVKTTTEETRPSPAPSAFAKPMMRVKKKKPQIY